VEARLSRAACAPADGSTRQKLEPSKDSEVSCGVQSLSMPLENGMTPLKMIRGVYLRQKMRVLLLRSCRSLRRLDQSRHCSFAVGFDTSAHLLFASLFVLQGRSWFLQESAHDRAPKDMIMSLLNRCMRFASCYEPDCEPLQRCCLICSRVKLERGRRPSLL
jgi:hypothetical protein